MMNVQESQALTISTNLKRNQDEMTSQDEVIETLMTEMNLMKKTVSQPLRSFRIEGCGNFNPKTSDFITPEQRKTSIRIDRGFNKTIVGEKNLWANTARNQQKSKRAKKEAKKESKKDIQESAPVPTPPASAKKTAEPSTSPANPSTPAPLPRSYASAVKSQFPRSFEMLPLLPQKPYCNPC